MDAEPLSSLSAVTLLAVTLAASVTVPSLIPITLMVTVTLARVAAAAGHSPAPCAAKRPPGHGGRRITLSG